MENLIDTLDGVLELAQDSTIKVMGVGGGGCNSVNYLYGQGVKDVTFLVCNTDKQSLERSSVPAKLQLGPGLGAGGKPEVAQEYAEQNRRPEQRGDVAPLHGLHRVAQEGDQREEGRHQQGGRQEHHGVEGVWQEDVVEGVVNRPKEVASQERQVRQPALFALFRLVVGSVRSIHNRSFCPHLQKQCPTPDFNIMELLYHPQISM